MEIIHAIEGLLKAIVDITVLILVINIHKKVNQLKP